MPENSHLNGSEEGGYFWTLKMEFPGVPDLDDRQITHLIGVRLKHLLSDVLGGCFGPPSCFFSYIEVPKTP